ncbi:MAG: type I-F CRISPR-associated protein Csy1 [Candidatus Thiodiazotropha sp. (ex Lucinoma borealis)]|nr:type I-F CRISPR-associated protein Csy1 [Candidatus Thiodiazotropha sp. (ex Lucinoma borealis)]MCU7868755.1 type I-F CRISPR-associated protein Csy1 [Candidatus Thiodiazotropha sp. (ex Lucinoma borealis)]
MSQEKETITEADTVKAAIHTFIEERLQPKLDKLKEGDDKKRHKLLQAHQPQNWIADAARRVGQIQQVTHALKYLHPDAKGSSLESVGNPAASELYIGTHTLPERPAPDVVGNAAALDVYKFLRLEVAGKNLLDRAKEKDAALQIALSDLDSEQAETWIGCFATLPESKGVPASHTLAKQLYWPLQEGEYHLLAPLFPTSLVHEVWRTIREDRFSEEVKAARDAHRKEHPYATGFREYPNLLIQTFGGTKPQNISQLNSERYGENYLLPSLPPNWNDKPLKPPINVDSVFDGWIGRRFRVRGLVRTLRGFLHRVELVNSNFHIRDKRSELVDYLIDEVVLFASELRELDAPWSADPACRLNVDEQCWLNPVRAEADEDFHSRYVKGEWKEAVTRRFANWLNARLADTKKTLPVGDDEAREWRRQFRKELDYNE